MGAGAVGCYDGFKLGARRTRCGANWAPSTRRGGLASGAQARTQPSTNTFASLPAPKGSVVQRAQPCAFCVKSTDTESAAAATSASCAGCVVLSSKTASRTRTDCARCCNRKYAAAYMSGRNGRPGFRSWPWEIIERRGQRRRCVRADRSRRADRKSSTTCAARCGEAITKLRVQRAIGVTHCHTAGREG